MVLLANVLNNYINSEKKNNEKSIKLESERTNEENINLKSTPTKNSSGISIVLLVLYFICGGIAAYFSWKHNSKIGWTTGYKVLFASFAFFCPFEYLSIYFTYKSDFLKYMERTNTEFVKVVTSPSVSSSSVSSPSVSSSSVSSPSVSSPSVSSLSVSSPSLSP